MYDEQISPLGLIAKADAGSTVNEQAKAIASLREAYEHLEQRLQLALKDANTAAELERDVIGRELGSLYATQIRENTADIYRLAAKLRGLIERIDF